MLDLNDQQVPLSSERAVDGSLGDMQRVSG